MVKEIHIYHAQHGYPPTIRELATGCKVSVSAMYRLLLQMDEQGVIDMPPG